MGEVVQDVADRNGLGAGANPGWGHHERQSLGEIPDHLETRRSTADHHGSSELDHIDVALTKDLADLPATLEMLTEFTVRQVGLQGAEIYESSHSLGAGSPRECPRHIEFDSVEVWPAHQ